jgi:hypothetical protein
VDIKIVEEWGYAMGEDTCLFEEEDGSESSQTDADVGHAEQEVSHNVDLLIEKIIDVEKDGDGDAAQGQSGVKAPNIVVSKVVDSEEDGRWFEEVRSPDRNVAVLPISGGSSGGSRVARAADTPQASESQASPTSRVPDGEDGACVRSRPRSTRATSCPPSEDRTGWPWPWSWEWLRDHNHDEAGVIFSASKRAKKGNPVGSCQTRGIHTRKASGVLRHPVHSFKKIARLPTKDRGEALKALGRCARRRRAGAEASSSNVASCQASSDVSPASGTNDDDWRNWVAVHGNDELALEDVRGIGKTIGVTFRGETRICLMLYPERRKVGRIRAVSFEVAWSEGGWVF